LLDTLIAEDWPSFEIAAVERTCKAGSHKVQVQSTRVAELTEHLNSETGAFEIEDGQSGEPALKVGCTPCEVGKFAAAVGAECEPCKKPSRCGKGNVCNFKFTGQGCSVCPAAHYELPEDQDNPDGSCEACPDKSIMSYVLLAFGVVVSVGTFIILAVNTPTLDKIGDAKSEFQKFVTMLKTTIVYIQSLALILGFKAWTTPDWVGKLGASFKQFSFFDFAAIFDGVSCQSSHLRPASAAAMKMTTTTTTTTTLITFSHSSLILEL
jgi:hypothetical protein